MFLAFKLSNLITIPFGWLLGWLYDVTSNYGIAMILFAVAVQMALLPITIKSKKTTMKMSRMQPRLQDIQKRYAGDDVRMNQAMQELYREEGVSMTGGCLWSLIPLFILFPLFTVIREPITYILGESAEVAAQIVAVVKELAPTAFNAKNNYYDQVTAAALIGQYASEIKAVIPAISADTLAGINFEFIGINVGAVPQFAFWNWDAFNWANFGLFLIPLLSAGAQVVQMKIMTKLNNSVITDENGIQDQKTAENSQMNQSNQMMMFMGPAMSLWIGFTVSGALSLYWFVGGIVRTIQDVILTSHFRKVYDAEDAVRLQLALEREKEEAERERIRAERRAANPEGQTQNTSKKKLAKAEKEKEAAAKAAAIKEYNAKKGIFEEEKPKKEALSGIPERPYCKGRAYDPNRYSSNTEE